MDSNLLHIFRPSPLRNWMQLLVFGGGFILLPIYALVMSYTAGTLDIIIGLAIGLFLILGILFCIAVLYKKIIMHRSEMFVFQGFKRKNIKYSDIDRISFKTERVQDNTSYSYYFVLDFKKDLHNKSNYYDSDFKINGLKGEQNYKIDLKILDSLEYKQLFLKTILHSNPSIQLDKTVLSYFNGEDPKVMKHRSFRD